LQPPAAERPIFEQHGVFLSAKALNANGNRSRYGLEIGLMNGFSSGPGLESRAEGNHIAGF
jgi:hypothetical protein